VIEACCEGLARPIPCNQVITLRTLADGSVLANWGSHACPVNSNGKFADGEASHFNVLDRKNGRIALYSLSTGGYATVKGEGGLAHVRIETDDQGDASTF
jgi:hypothetical protein